MREALDTPASINGKNMVRISEYLDPDYIQFLEASSRDDVITALVDKMSDLNVISDSKSLFDAIIEREKIVTTGIGMGVAIPHAKLPGYDSFFIALGILKTGVEWNALDGSPVRLVFLIAGPDDKQTEYLQILSALTQAVKHDDLRKTLLTTKTPEEAYKLFKGF